MAVLLHGFIDDDKPTIYLNVNIGTLVTIPINITLASREITIRTANKNKVFRITDDADIGRYSPTKNDIERAIKIVETKLMLNVFDDYSEATLKLLNNFATIIIIAINHNTRLRFLGKKSINIAFFNGVRSYVGEIKIALKLKILGIISLAFKILSAR